MSREKRDGSFVRKRQEGSAMVVVMCVMLITTILCLELLLAASASARNIRRIGERTQCRVNAYSVSGVLIDEITGVPEYGDVTEDGALREDGNSVRSQLQTAFHKIENGERRLGEKLEYELAPGTLPGEAMVDLLMVSKYFERIGDHAVNIAKWVLFSLTGNLEFETAYFEEGGHQSEK